MRGSPHTKTGETAAGKDKKKKDKGEERKEQREKKKEKESPNTLKWFRT